MDEHHDRQAQFDGENPPREPIPPAAHRRGSLLAQLTAENPGAPVQRPGNLQGRRNPGMGGPRPTSPRPVPEHWRERWAPRSELPLILAGALFLLLATWVALADIHYRMGATWFPFANSGWFWLLAVVFAAFGLVYGKLFALTARTVGDSGAWLALLLCSTILLSLACYWRSPSRVLERLIGEAAFDQIHIEEFHVTDSFLKGDFYRGILTGSPEILETIAHHLKLHPENLPAPNLRHVFPKVMFPEDLYAYTDPGCIFYWHPEQQKIFFLYRTKVKGRRTVDLSSPPEPEVRIPAQIRNWSNEPEVKLPSNVIPPGKKYVPPGADDAEE